MTIKCYQVFHLGRLSLSVSTQYGFPLTSFHLAEANLVPRAIKKKINMIFFVFILWEKDALGSRLNRNLIIYFFHGFTFLCVQLPKNITKCFLKKGVFIDHFAINLFYLHNLKT